MSGLVLFGRSRLSRSVALALLASLVATTVLQGRTFVAPVIPWDIIVLTSPLLPVLVAVVALRACEPTLVDLESTLAGRRLPLVRLAWGVGLMVVLAGLCTLTAVVANALAFGVAIEPLSLALGFVSFFAAGLLGALVLGADLGWLPPCLLTVALVFFGRDPDQAPRAWAWVLHSPSLPGPWLLTLLLAAAALTGYSQQDTVGLTRAGNGATTW